MGFRVNGLSSSISIPKSKFEEKKEAENRISELAERISKVSTREIVKRSDPELSGPLSSALTLSQFPNSNSNFTKTRLAESQKTFLSAQAFVSPEEEINQVNPNQADLEKLRSAIKQVSRDYMNENPTATIDDLKGRLDNVFGSGFSDLLHIRQTDQFNGKTEVSIDQVNWKDLKSDEQRTMAKAARVAKENFSFSKETKLSESSSESSAFLDDTKFTYNSGRYKNSYGPSEVAETASLTENSDYINKISRT